MHEPSTDLVIAREAIEQMAKAKQFSDFHRHWQDFLYRIERSWESTLGRMKHLKGGAVQIWISDHSSKRKKDSLLKYLKHARDAETHVLGETVESTFELSLEDKLKRKFRVNGISNRIEGSTLIIDIDSPDSNLEWLVNASPGDPRMLRFKSRGVWYNPPSEHLGNRLPDLHPVAIALLGYEFYTGAEKRAREAEGK